MADAIGEQGLETDRQGQPAAHVLPQAMAVAEEGLRQEKGCMDELRQFVAKRAKSAGNRERYLALQFEQAVDPLACDKYKAFRKLCTAAEWKSYEANILARLKSARDTEQLRIRMHRKEYEEAVAVLGRSRYPLYVWDNAYGLQTARRLEGRYPEAILKYSELGNLKTNAPRRRDFGLEVKQDNIKRPAFQEKFAKAVPGWRALKQHNDVLFGNGVDNVINRAHQQESC